MADVLTIYLLLRLITILFRYVIKNINILCYNKIVELYKYLFYKLLFNTLIIKANHLLYSANLN